MTRKHYILLVAALYAILFTSCKTAEQHYQAFLKKGGSIDPDTVTLTLKETIIKDGDTVYQDKPVKIPCPEAVINTPPTRRELRFDRLIQRDSLKHIEKMFKLQMDSIENAHQLKLDSLELSSKTTIKLEREKSKQLETQLKNERKLNKSSVFWTWIGKRWWLIFILGMLTILIILFVIRRKA